MAAYIEQLGMTASKPTVKRMWPLSGSYSIYLTAGGILDVNPAASVRAHAT